MFSARFKSKKLNLVSLISVGLMNNHCKPEAHTFKSRTYGMNQSSEGSGADANATEFPMSDGSGLPDDFGSGIVDDSFYDSANDNLQSISDNCNEMLSLNCASEHVITTAEGESESDYSENSLDSTLYSPSQSNGSGDSDYFVIDDSDVKDSKGEQWSEGSSSNCAEDQFCVWGEGNYNFPNLTKSWFSQDDLKKCIESAKNSGAIIEGIYDVKEYHYGQIDSSQSSNDNFESDETYAADFYDQRAVPGNTKRIVLVWTVRFLPSMTYHNQDKATTYCIQGTGYIREDQIQSCHGTTTVIKNHGTWNFVKNPEQDPNCE